MILGDFGFILESSGVISQVVSTFSTSGGNDTILGGSDDDVILGGIGDDLIWGDNNTPTLSGTDGNDRIVGDSGSVTYSGGMPVTIQNTFTNDGGNDTLFGEGGNDLILGGVRNDSISGGTGADVLLGDNGTASYWAGLPTSVSTVGSSSGGDDVISGDAGNDVILGGFGHDLIDGGTENDVLFGDNGTVKFLNGSVSSASTVDSSLGVNDTLLGGSGDDAIFGGAGADSIVAGSGDDVAFGDNGQVQYLSGSLSKAFTTDAWLGGNDVISGDGGADLIIGGAGNDTVSGGDDADILFGDYGSVSYSYNRLSSIATTDPSSGGTDFISAGLGNDVVFGGAGNDWITGDIGADLIAGDSGEAKLSLGRITGLSTTDATTGGNDTISGGDGNDGILGGYGADSLSGDSGDDAVLGDNGFGRRHLVRGAPPANVSDPAIGGSDTIDGGSGNDVLIGGDGTDSISGGLGNDLIFGDQGQYTSAYSFGTLYPDSASGGSDTIHGNDGNDSIFGGQGNDLIYGDTGNDLLEGGFRTSGGNVGTDQILSGTGTDTLSNNFTAGVPSVPLTMTFEVSTDFSSPVSSNFSTVSGFWSQGSGLYQTTSYSTTSPSVSILKVSPGQSSSLYYQATVNTRGLGGLIFDYKSPFDYKYAAIVPASNQVVLKQVSGQTTIVVATSSKFLSTGADTRLGLVLNGSSVTVYVNNMSAMTHNFPLSVSTGQVGLLGLNGQTLFKDLALWGNNSSAGSSPLFSPYQVASSAPVGGSTPVASLTDAQLQSVVGAAESEWTGRAPSVAQALANVRFQIADLPGLTLGEASSDDSTITIDPTAAGFGWFVDSSPLTNEEFAPTTSLTLHATTAQASTGMDLLTVVLHELGHVLGLSDAEVDDPTNPLMNETLSAGTRRLLETVPVQTGQSTPQGPPLPPRPPLVSSTPASPSRLVPVITSPTPTTPDPVTGSVVLDAALLDLYANPLSRPMRPDPLLVLQAMRRRHVRV